MLSLIVPVFRNEASLPRLLVELADLQRALPVRLEVVFVIDGSPDRSADLLRERLHDSPLSARLVELSRNFGSFAAILAGMNEGRGDYYAVMAADLQEPTSLVAAFVERLRRGDADVVFGCRATRQDPWFTTLSSNAFWGLYRRLVIKDMPKGGVDCFAMTRAVRDEVLRCPEVTTNLVALLFWMGFRREFVPYDRQERREGRSGWTFSKKLRYFLDSVFAFTDLPARILLYAGSIGLVVCAVIAVVLVVLRLRGEIPVLGYTPLALGILALGAFASLGFGVVGQYAWLSLQNARRRPNFLVASSRAYTGTDGTEGDDGGRDAP